MPASLAQIAQAAQRHKLDILGLLPGKRVGDATGKTMLLLGPGPGFWQHFIRSPEYLDRQSDPLDRWSRRTIDAIASAVDGDARYPFEQDPPLPFITWALQSGHFWQSPVGLLVHASQGLWASLRGALLVDLAEPLPPVPRNPCEGCRDKPCLIACPCNALTTDGYDVAACHSFLDTAPGSDCMEGGCLVRRTCPASESFPREKDQSAFHMKAFHR